MFPKASAGTARDIELEVHGQIPAALSGSLVIAASRRPKDRGQFGRWHDSQADLIRIQVKPPGRVTARILQADPSGADVVTGFQRTSYEQRAYGRSSAYGYATQPNHGLNIAAGKLWATNLLFGAPLEVDIASWRPRRILRYVDPDEQAPRVSSTSHFAQSLDGRYLFFEQSLLTAETESEPVRSTALKFIRIDSTTGASRVWDLKAPPDDDLPEAENFHSAFYWEEQGRKFVGLLRTGAVVESLAPHSVLTEHSVLPLPSSTIWAVEVDESRSVLQAFLLPGVRELGGIALSHLDVDASGADGFVLYANYKQADVGEETHGLNIYGHKPDLVPDHYSGMTVEAINIAKILRYERRNGGCDIRTYERAYDPDRAILGHTWLPINIQLDASRKQLFCNFSGFHPRLLSAHIAKAYPGMTVDTDTVREVPPLLMRFDADRLEPEYESDGAHLVYNEPLAMVVVGDSSRGWMCTFSPDRGLRICRANDLTRTICTARSPELNRPEEGYFRPQPPHMLFVAD
jgi:hypothetical protein